MQTLVDTLLQPTLATRCLSRREVLSESFSVLTPQEFAWART
jgi:hypothetical protein